MTSDFYMICKFFTQFVYFHVNISHDSFTFTGSFFTINLFPYVNFHRFIWPMIHVPFSHDFIFILHISFPCVRVEHTV